MYTLFNVKVQAQQEEKTIKDRAVTKGGYASAAVNVLRRLRDVTSPHTTGCFHVFLISGVHSVLSH